MLENLQINTYTTEYTSIKKVHTFFVFFIKKTQGGPLQNACDPLSLCKSKWALQSKSTTSTKGKGEKEQK
jgi:hypothetical protein